MIKSSKIGQPTHVAHYGWTQYPEVNFSGALGSYIQYQSNVTY